MLHYAAFHLGLHCLPWYLFAGIQNEKSKRGVKILSHEKSSNYLFTDPLVAAVSASEARIVSSLPEPTAVSLNSFTASL